MESWHHALQIVMYMHRLEDQDYLYINDALTSLFNWIIPSFVGGWLVKRLYIMNHPTIPLLPRMGLSLLPLVSPFSAALLNYNIYYRRDSTFQNIFLKYPSTTNFKERKRVNPFKLKESQKSKAK